MDTSKLLRSIARAKPKSQRVLFFGRDEFSDNSKYLFIHAVMNARGMEPVWCTQNTGLAAELARAGLPVFDMKTAGEAKTLNFLIEAKAAVFCTNMLESLKSFAYLDALAGAEKIQLWHGISIKKLDLMLTPYQNLSDNGFLTQLAGVLDVDRVISPSSLEDDFWRQAFGVKEVIRAGLPRNEVLLRPANEYELINSLSPDAFFSGRSAPIVLFSPTYSRTGTPLWEDQAVVGEILRFTLDRGGHLVIKPHPFEASKVPPGGLFDEAFTLLPASFDIYPLLSRVDIVVTDYSSMFIDFMVTGKPFVTIDVPENRPFDVLMHDPERYRRAGPMVPTRELYNILTELADNDAYRELRREVVGQAFQTSVGSACQDILGFLENIEA